MEMLRFAVTSSYNSNYWYRELHSCGTNTIQIFLLLTIIIQLFDTS